MQYFINHSNERTHNSNQLQRFVRKSESNLYEQSKKKEGVKKCKYELCLRHYMNALGNRSLDQIKLDQVNSLGKVYYMIKTAFEKDYYQNGHKKNNNFPIISLNININALVNNANMTEEFFGAKSAQKGDSQRLLNFFNNPFGLVDESAENHNNSLFIDNYRLLLILKGRKVKECNHNNNMNFYFSFYLENKALMTVELAYSEKVSRIDMAQFNNIMKNLKFDEDVLIVFGYNPIIYFNVESGNYFNPYYEKVFFIDSAKTNQKIEEIWKKIYN